MGGLSLPKSLSKTTFLTGAKDKLAVKDVYAKVKDAKGGTGTKLPSSLADLTSSKLPKDVKTPGISSTGRDLPTTLPDVDGEAKSLGEVLALNEKVSCGKGDILDLDGVKVDIPNVDLDKARMPPCHATLPDLPSAPKLPDMPNIDKFKMGKLDTSFFDKFKGGKSFGDINLNMPDFDLSSNFSDCLGDGFDLGGGGAFDGFVFPDIDWTLPQFNMPDFDMPDFNNFLGGFDSFIKGVDIPTSGWDMDLDLDFSLGFLDGIGKFNLPEFNGILMNDVRCKALSFGNTGVLDGVTSAMGDMLPGAMADGNLDMVSSLADAVGPEVINSMKSLDVKEMFAAFDPSSDNSPSDDKKDVDKLLKVAKKIDPKYDKTEDGKTNLSPYSKLTKNGERALGNHPDTKKPSKVSKLSKFKKYAKNDKFKKYAKNDKLKKLVA